MRQLFYLYLIFLSLSFTSNSQERFGDISGKIFDVKTLEPIPSANIFLVEKPELGTSSNLDGVFLLKTIPVGTYSLKISALGYSSQIVTNTVVVTGRATPITIKLEEKSIEMQTVTAEATYFSRAQQMSPVSSSVFVRAEVLRSPGGIQDVQRVAQSLPGVASSTDNINELIVRGGAPFENLTILDQMEIPSINHYSNQFNSAGPINMVNADMIEDVQFSSGGFPAQYGDKTSSVMNLTVREGDKKKSFASNTVMNMAGIGMLIEGGFANEKGSYIFSIRNSLLEVIDKAVGISKISLTAIPKYWDMQSKLTYDFSQSQKLIFNVLYGDSRINFVGDPKLQDTLRRNVLDSSSVETLYPVTKQYAVGLSLRSLFGKEGYSMFTLYSSGTSTDITVQEDFAVRQRDANGDVNSYTILNTQKVFANNMFESFLGAKYELFYQPHPLHSLSLGGQIQTAQKWRDDLFFGGDTSRYDFDNDGIFETGPIAVNAATFLQHFKFGDASKYYLFASDKYLLTSSFAFTLGFRYDHFTYAGKGAFSPRASLSYQFIPSISTATFAVGEYAQVHPLPFYGDRFHIGFNRNLDYMKATHYVLGYEHILGEGFKFSVETYYKNYRNIAVSEEFIYQAAETVRTDKIHTIGKRHSYGTELFLEQKQVADYFGTLSVSFSKTEMKDSRIPPMKRWYTSEFDYPVILTALGGKVVKGVRDWCDNAPFYIKYPSYIFPFSNEMEISFKFRYQSGRPYTPLEYVLWKQNREGGVHWSPGAWVSSKKENSVRYPDYSRLDFQWLSRYNHSGYNINVYIAMMNIFNTKNVFYENHRSDGTIETVYQFAFFPVAGVEVEF